MAAFAAVPSADAQWFPPVGAAPPGEIVQRLQAEGYVLIQPLRRNDTVYLADVSAGTGGRERLVIDAWSGEILQRFVARRGSGRPGFTDGYVVEGGEFNSPPPLAPPPERTSGMGASLTENPAVPAGRPVATIEGQAKAGGHSQQTGRAKPGDSRRASSAARQAASGNGNAANPGASAAVAPTAAPPNAETSPSRPSRAAQRRRAEIQRRRPLRLRPRPQTQTEGRLAVLRPDVAAPAVPTPAAKRGDKSKVNDVPVNPLE